MCVPQILKFPYISKERMKKTGERNRRERKRHARKGESN